MQTTHGGVGQATIKRLIANFSWHTTGANYATTLQDVFVGICVVTLDALTAGAVPDPNSDFNQDWYYWTSRIGKFSDIAAPQTVDWSIDIRSQRRLRGGYALAMVINNGDGNADICDLHIAIRALWTQQA